MKTITIKNIQYLLLIAVGIFSLSACSEEVLDPDYDGEISGVIMDQNGNPVSGDLSTAALTVFVLGEQDRVPLEIRVGDDGTYRNTQLYPQNYSVWVEGPIDAPGPTNVDLNSGAKVNDITVTPFLVLSPPAASVSGNSITIDYNVSPSTGHAIDEVVVLVSTVAKVGVDTADGPTWQTRKETVTDASGSVTVDLDSELLTMADERGDGDLHIRIAARSDQTSDWNYSTTIEVDAP